MYIQYTLTTVSVKLLFMASTIFKLIPSAINHSCQSITDRYRHSAARVSTRVRLRLRKETFISRSVTVNLTYFKRGSVQTNYSVCFSGLSRGEGGLLQIQGLRLKNVFQKFLHKQGWQNNSACGEPRNHGVVCGHLYNTHAHTFSLVVPQHRQSTFFPFS